MTEYIDMHTHEILDDDDMHDRYDAWLDEIYGEVNIGYSTFSPAEILRELEPITYRVGFSDFENFASEDNSIISLDDSPECEDCGEKMDRDEIVVALANHDRLMCESCEEDEGMDYCYECDKVTEWNDEKCAGCGRTWGYDKGEGPDDQ